MLERFFLPHGRIGRLRFWRAVAIIGIAFQVGLLAAITLVLGPLGIRSDLGTATIVSVPVAIAAWSATMAGIRRLHDRDRSAWWMLLALVPVGGAIWYLFANGTIPGSPGHNRFGAPDGRSGEIAAVFGEVGEGGTAPARRAGLAGTIALWLALAATSGVMVLLFRDPNPPRPPATSSPSPSP